MTEKMTRQQVAEFIAETVAAARAKGRRADLRDVDLSYANLANMDLSTVNLHGVNMSGANLVGANLRGAHLAEANLSYTNLHGANLLGANLNGANLRYTTLLNANLKGANLVGANLAGADLTGLKVEGMPSGSLLFIPTPEGWHLSIGCWDGTLADLRELIAKDDGWPEAEGEEVAARRPILAAAADLCEAHAAARPDALAKVTGVADRWKDNEK